MTPMNPDRPPPPLAWTEEGIPFYPPEPTRFWRVREHTGKPGRPPAVWTKHGILHLALDADMATLRRALGERVGHFRLYPTDAAGMELTPIACVEVVPDEDAAGTALATTGPSGLSAMSEEAARNYAQVPLRFFDLYERMLTSRDAHDGLMTGLLTTLVQTTATIQDSTANLIGAANTTVKVANGVEGLDRLVAQHAQHAAPVEQLAAGSDIEGLTEKLAAIEKLQSQMAKLGIGQGKPNAPWFLQLLNGPVGAMALNFANNFAQSAAAALAAQQAEGDEE